MDWKQYSSRLKESGPAIRSGDRSTITTIIVKKNLIEFQLDGGGFGTFWDDTSTTVTPYEVGKSSYEKQLERDIKDTTDPNRKRDLQRELDRERSRRRREQAADDRAAMIASQMKQQQVADKRMRGGSRFNLRWTGNIPSDQLTPDGLMKAARYLRRLWRPAVREADFFAEPNACGAERCGCQFPGKWRVSFAHDSAQARHVDRRG